MADYLRSRGNSHDLFNEWQEAAQQFGVSAGRNDRELQDRAHAAQRALYAYLDAVSSEMSVLKRAREQRLHDDTQCRARVAAALKK